MNPDTGQFEELESVMQEARAREKGWKVYETGEVVDFKGWAFEIVNVNAVTQRIVLKLLTPEERDVYFEDKPGLGLEV